MGKITNWLKPKEEEFYTLLAEQSTLAFNGIGKLRELMDGYAGLDEAKRAALIEQIHTLEHEGDALQHRILAKLDKAFITPFDKEDIHRLAVLLDDLLDEIHGAALRLSLLGVAKIDEHMTTIIRVAHLAVGEVHEEIARLRHLEDIGERHKKVHRLEHEADDACHAAVHKLFHERRDPVDVIRYKEMYERLEHITDRCMEVSHVVGSIVVKHA